MDTRESNEETSRIADGGKEPESTIDTATYWAWHKVQLVIDILALYILFRWIIVLAIFSFFAYRVALNQGIWSGRLNRISCHFVFLGTLHAR